MSDYKHYVPATIIGLKLPRDFFFTLFDNDVNKGDLDSLENNKFWLDVFGWSEPREDEDNEDYIETLYDEGMFRDYLYDNTFGKYKSYKIACVDTNDSDMIYYIVLKVKLNDGRITYPSEEEIEKFKTACGELWSDISFGIWTEYTSKYHFE